MIEDTRERYKCECPCGNIFYAAMSIFQSWGVLDAGHGSCPECNAFYNLTLQKEFKSMKLTPWNEYIKNKDKDGGVEENI